MPENNDPPPLDDDQIAAAADLIGLSFTPQERQMMEEGLATYRRYYAGIRDHAPANQLSPALLFRPDLWQTEPPPLPDDEQELAFWPLEQLANLLHSGRYSAVALTELYLERLQRYDPLLHCTITLTPELARAQAQRADEELKAGLSRGPLHGIPYGVKDLLAVRGYPTTWGAAPYREQRFDYDATVVQRLADAGAVLLGKLSSGALAWGDVWFGGTTRTPWQPEQGASGSSAGPGAATAAGLVGFAIGTETWGSIVSPATRNGVSGLRPSFGRVSRHGAMALSWSMDKIGPMARSAADCAWVFAAIHGPDGHDPTVVEQPFEWPRSIELSGLRVGYLADDFARDYRGAAQDQRTLHLLQDLGCQLVPLHLPELPIEALQIILVAEAAAAFDELTRSNRDDELVRQSKDAWPNVFRQARLIPAVEYIQANRLRTQLMQAMAALLADVDLYVAPSLAGDNLLLTNLTGHPAVVVPNGFADDGLPTSISFCGHLYDESTVLAVAAAYQNHTDHHLSHPQLPFPQP